MLTKSDILELIENNKDKIFSFGVQRISLFGSYVKNLEKDTSDIDLLVEFKDKQKSFDNFMELSFFMNNLFGKKTEIITPESLSLFMREKISMESENVISN